MTMKGSINLHESMSNAGSLVAKADIWNNLVMSNICFAKHKKSDRFLHSSLSTKTIPSRSSLDKWGNTKHNIKTFDGGIYYEI